MLKILYIVKFDSTVMAFIFETLRTTFLNNPQKVIKKRLSIHYKFCWHLGLISIKIVILIDFDNKKMGSTSTNMNGHVSDASANKSQVFGFVSENKSIEIILDAMGCYFKNSTLFDFTSKINPIASSMISIYLYYRDEFNDWWFILLIHPEHTRIRLSRLNSYFVIAMN